MEPKKEKRKWSQRKRKENGAKDREKEMEPKKQKRKLDGGKRIRRSRNAKMEIVKNGRTLWSSLKRDMKRL